MDIRLEIVAGDRRMAVFDLRPVEAPQSLNDFALPRGQAHAAVAAVPCACAGLREEALRAEALDLCRADPQIWRKDHRRRNVPTLLHPGGSRTAAAGPADRHTARPACR